MKIYVVATTNELKLLDNYNIESDDRIIVTGIGATNVIKALKDIDVKTPVVNVGYCGSNILPVGTIVSVSKCTTYHPIINYKEAEYTLGQVGSRKVPFDEKAICFTNTDFVTATKYSDPCVFDMELAFICSLGFFDVRSDKYVSDNLSLDEYERNSK